MSLLRRRMMMQQRESLILELQSITENTTWINGIYIDAYNGNEVKYGGWKATDYIPIESNSFLFVTSNNRSANYNAFYDSEKTYIKGIVLNNENNSEGLIIKIPENARYVRFSNSESNAREVEAYGVKAI